ncbi:MAG: NAD(P)H-hydrate dehydratase [bacterium]
MQAAWPVSAVRRAEAALMATLPGGALMERAAAGLATALARDLGRSGGTYGRSVLLLVGPGNNGGDVLFAGARLADRGARVSALLTDRGRAHPSGLAAFRAAGGLVLTSRAMRGPDLFASADLVVDGLLGIGGVGGLRPPADSWAEWAARAGVRVVAVDVPSGVDADTGAVDGAAVRADVTVTFGALKPGLLVGDGAERSGEVRLVDIGLGPHLNGPVIQVLEVEDVARALASPGPRDDKYTRGVVGVAAGSAQYTGAAVMCTGAALHGGAGMVRYAGAAADAVRARWPEAVVTDRLEDAGRVQAWVVGPGLGTGPDAVRALKHVLGSDVPVLVDADGITVLAQHRELLERRRAPTVLTPHDREFERIFGPVGPDRVGATARAARASGAVVLLKGNATVVAGASSVFVNRTGTPWLATAGTGDVLSGLTGSILARGAAPERAAALGAFVHGVAGQRAASDGPPSAGDVLAALRPALETIAEGRRRRR